MVCHLKLFYLSLASVSMFPLKLMALESALRLVDLQVSTLDMIVLWLAIPKLLGT